MELKRNTENHPNILTNNFGLSDEVQTIIMNLGEDSSTATAFKMSGMKYHDTYYTQEIEGTLRKASDYVKENHILSIDYLKIDTEGMDLKVIKGFEDTINLVRVIQFEYGIFNIASHDLLYDIFQYLNSYNFTVGKIFPRYVKFFDYHFDQENFYGGNYLAVKKDDKELLAKLQLRATS
jgi:FkbM family methyltransferase